MNSYVIFNLIAVIFGAILLSELLPTLATTIKPRSFYGQPCDKTTRCTSGASLTCRNEVCECAKPDTMTFNPEIRKCVVNVNEICKYLVETDNENEMEYNQYTGTMQKIKRYEVEQCMTNAECNESGICSCKSSYFENSNGSCTSSGSRGESCTTTVGCRSDLFLACVDGTCQCDPDRSLLSPYQYDPSTLICVGLIDKPCLNGYCVPQGHCDNEFCKCAYPFAPSRDRKTCDSVIFGVDCSKRRDNMTCHSNFTCVDNRCKCKYDADHQVYDPVTTSCRSLVGGPCDLSGPSEQCVKNSKCVPNDQTNFPECRCVQPYVPNREGRCDDLDIDAPCSSGSQYPGYAKCDQMVPLYCKDEKCSCVDELKIYDQDARKCKARVGSICSNDESCVRNATCRFRDGILRGQCECINLGNLTANRTCDSQKSEKFLNNN